MTLEAAGQHRGHAANDGTAQGLVENCLFSDKLSLMNDTYNVLGNAKAA